jgi:hypothetical protein
MRLSTQCYDLYDHDHGQPHYLKYYSVVWFHLAGLAWIAALGRLDAALYSKDGLYCTNVV